MDNLLHMAVILRYSEILVLLRAFARDFRFIHSSNMLLFTLNIICYLDIDVSNLVILILSEKFAVFSIFHFNQRSMEQDACPRKLRQLRSVVRIT